MDTNTKRQIEDDMQRRLIMASLQIEKYDIFLDKRKNVFNFEANKFHAMKHILKYNLYSLRNENKAADCGDCKFDK